MSHQHPTTPLPLVLALACLGVVAAPPSWAAEVKAAPEWVRAHMADMVGDWRTDNAAYVSEEETDDAYGLTWEWGLGEAFLNGRLYGLREGRETATYWSFRTFWHPGEEALVVQQIGSTGALGIGRVSEVGPGRYRSEETFYWPGAEPWESAHDFTVTGPDAHETVSWQRTAGEWEKRRTYVWKRVSGGGEAGR